MKSIGAIVLLFVVLIQINLIAKVICLTPRTITVVNQCGEDYHYLVTSGSDSDTPCSTGCNAWSSCNNANNKCYFNPPSYNGTLGFVEAGQSIQLTFHNYGSPTLWSGNIGFCQSGANCYSSTESIYFGVGIISNDLGPANLAEITMLSQGIDYYDISNINGISATFQFGPSIQNQCTNNGDPYYCGVAGAPNPINSQVAPSFWNFSNADIRFKWVIPTSDPPVTCSQENPTCPNGLVCGLNLTYATSSPQLVCGTQYGWWTADQLCAASTSMTLYQCNDDYTFGGSQVQFRELYGCTDAGATGSCYTIGANSECCGCVNWNDVFGYQVTPAITMLCQNTNSYWTTTVLPTLTWLKEACPTCYTYPYDDKSSSFTCAIYDNNGYNNQNYTITLCPTHNPNTPPQQAGDPSQCPDTSFLCSYTNYFDTLYYIPTQSTCYDNEYLCTTPTEALCLDASGNHNCFDATAQTCTEGYLCALGDQACVGPSSHACFNPAQYCCVNGNLYQSSDPTCSANPATASTTGSGVVVVSGSGETVTISSGPVTSSSSSGHTTSSGSQTTHTNANTASSSSSGSQNTNTNTNTNTGSSTSTGSQNPNPSTNTNTNTGSSTTTGNPVVVYCNGTTYDTTLYSCFDGLHLCPKGEYACVELKGKFACYNPDTHSCSAGLISGSNHVSVFSFGVIVLVLVTVEVFVGLVAI